MSIFKKNWGFCSVPSDDSGTDLLAMMFLSFGTRLDFLILHLLLLRRWSISKLASTLRIL